MKFSADGNVYESDGKITKLIGGLVIERIEGDEKVTYTFDPDIGDYVETSREPYTPPEPEPDPLSLLEEENALLALELIQTQLRLDQVEQEQADLLLLLVSEEVI